MTSEKGRQPFDIADPFARKLLIQYLDNRKSDVDKLTDALAKSDFDTIRITGHNLYGSGAAYGLEDISFIGAGIESAANSSDGPQIERLIGELTDFLTRLKVY